MLKLPLKIEGLLVRLRPLKTSDAEDIYKNVKDKIVSQYLSQVPYPYPKHLALKYIKTTQRNRRLSRSLTLGIVPCGINRVVGLISLMNINKQNQEAFLGYWLGYKYWNQGYMSEAVNLMLNFGFVNLKLHRVSANTFEENKISQRILKRAGFKIEGKAINKICRFNKWHSEIQFGLLDSDYFKNEKYYRV